MADAGPPSEPDAETDTTEATNADSLTNGAASSQHAAPHYDTVVVGAGIAGLTLAYDLAERGYRVLVLEAASDVGGVVQRHEVGGIELDKGAESFATRGGTVAELLNELGMADDIVDPEPGGAWLQLRRRAVPMPRNSVLGIPASPLARDVIAALGMRQALRAYLDRLMPVVKLGKDAALGPLVERRMGKAVLDRLVSPISGGVYSSSARDLDVSVVAPGLNEAMTRAGSLSGGVALLRADAPAGRPGSAVRGIRGGMHRLPAALAARIQRMRGEIRTDTVVTGAARTEAGWRVETESGSVTASSLVIATPAAAALSLLSQLDLEGDVPDATAWPAPAAVELVTLIVDGAAISHAPRGSGALVAEDAGLQAKALTQATAKWSWLRESANDAAVLRLSYGRVGEQPHTETLTDAESIAVAHRDAAAILGVELAPPIAGARVRWEQAGPSAVIGVRERQHSIRDIVGEESTLEVVGSWIAGTGLAQVIPDARAAALRIRRDNFVQPGEPWFAESPDAADTPDDSFA